MKKIYLQPEMECQSMNMAWCLCAGSDPINDNAQPGYNDSPDPFAGGAPGRKVF